MHRNHLRNRHVHRHCHRHHRRQVTVTFIVTVVVTVIVTTTVTVTVVAEALLHLPLIRAGLAAVNADPERYLNPIDDHDLRDLVHQPAHR